MNDYMQPVYLGDGLYARFDGWQIWLEASDGENVLQRVALDPGVQLAFRNYHEELSKHIQSLMNPGEEK